MKAHYVSRQWENQARTIISFYFRPERPFAFEAGQYTDLTVPCAAPDSRGITRTMTVSSGPQEALLRITTRLSPDEDRLSTYKRSLLALGPGGPVALTDAMGDMILPLDTAIPLVFVAGGVGIASYASIISQLLAGRQQRDITLLYAVSSVTDIALQTDFDHYARFHRLTRAIYTPAVNSRLDLTAWPAGLVADRLQASHIAAAMQPDSQVYLSGSATMVESLRGELMTTYGVAQYRIAFDYFDGYLET